MLALKRRGRYGLVFLDAHSDFRHLGNSDVIGAAAGEDLAIITGLGDSRLVDLEKLKPYVLNEDIYVLGIRDNDENLDELSNRNIKVATSQQIIRSDLDNIIGNVLDIVTQNTSGFWIHLDLDVVDSSEMIAVDSPEPNGLTFPTLSKLVTKLFRSENCIGIEITIYDPDLDPTGSQANEFLKNKFIKS